MLRGREYWWFFQMDLSSIPIIHIRRLTMA